MKLIKTKPKYKCAYCNHTSGEASMIVHEMRCWKNPKRYCDYCKNKGYTVEVYDEGLSEHIDCPYCSKRKIV